MATAAIIMAAIARSNIHLTQSHPVSWSQSQLLTEHLVDSTTAAHNILTSFWLHGPLSSVTLRGALAALVERQLAEFWRTASTDDQAVMRACSMNLVAVCTDEPGDIARATDDMARVAEAVPPPPPPPAPLATGPVPIDELD